MATNLRGAVLSALPNDRDEPFQFVSGRRRTNRGLDRVGEILVRHAIEARVHERTIDRSPRPEDPRAEVLLADEQSRDAPGMHDVASGSPRSCRLHRRSWALSVHWKVQHSPGESQDLPFPRCRVDEVEKVPGEATMYRI